MQREDAHTHRCNKKYMTRISYIGGGSHSQISTPGSWTQQKVKPAERGYWYYWGQEGEKQGEWK